MANIFLSHSSADKPFVRRLANDLKSYGHTPWLDEWEIKIGDCIVSKIETGISKADFVILVLSTKAVQSGWVEKEWKSKYWNEVNDKKVMVLPVLVEDCQIPELIKTKKYADFRQDYSYAFDQLVDALPELSDEEEGKTKVSETNCPAESAPRYYKSTRSHINNLYLFKYVLIPLGILLVVSAVVALIDIPDTAHDVDPSQKKDPEILSKTVVLTPIDDRTASAGDYTGNFTKLMSADLGALYAYASSSDNSDAYRAILEFELPSELQNKHVIEAVLYFHRTSAGGSPETSGFKVYGYVGNGVVELQDATRISNQLGGILRMWDSEQYLDVTDYIKSFDISSNKFPGFVIRGYFGQGGLHSSEGFTEEYRPKLTITYRLDGGQTGSFANQ